MEVITAAFGLGLGLLGAQRKQNSVTPPTGFVLTDISSGRLFQRTKALTTGPVSASGTYTGGTPNAVELQVHKVSDDSIVKAWTTASAAIAGGAWSATITGVAQGGSYYVKARPSNATALAKTGSNPFYIGILTIMDGQSNMLFMSSVAATPPAASAGTTYFDGAAWGAVPAANGIREFLNGLIAATGVPCAALNGAFAGVAISALEPGDVSGHYTDIAAQITAAGGDAEFVIWHQGEGDVTGPTAKNTYQASLVNIHSSIATLVGRTRAQIPLVLSSLSTNTNTGASDANWDSIQSTLRDCEVSLTACYYSHSNMDATLSDGTHWGGASYGESGKRYARTLSFILGSVATRPKWFITASATIDATHTDVTIVHAMGTDFTPTSAISGFEVSGDNGGTWAAPSAAARTSATVIRLTHASIATNSARRLRYQYGHLADVTAPVLDNGSLTAPLDRTDGIISPAPLATAPVFTYRTRSQLTLSGGNLSQSGLNIVNAAADLLLVVGIAQASPRAITGATITPNGGSPISNTIVQNDSANVGVAIVQFAIPSGTDLTNATLAVTYTSAVFNNGTGVFSTIPQADLSSTTKVDSKSATSASATAASITTLTTSSGGAVFSIAAIANTGDSNTWSGTETYTERSDAAGAGIAVTNADASNTGASAGASTVTATFTPTAAAVRVSAASWR